MAVLFLACGGVAYVDDEDYDAVKDYHWAKRALCPSRRLAAKTRSKANGRWFDVFLHRLIACRIDPQAPRKGFRVHPKDGDYFNCRRDNLEIAYTRRKTGRGSARQAGGGGWRAGKSGSKLSRPLSADIALLWNPYKTAPGWRPRRTKAGRRRLERAGAKVD